LPAGITDSVVAAAWAPDGKRVVAADRDRMVKLWDVGTGALLVTFPQLPAEPSSIAFTPDGDEILVGTEDGDLIVFASDGSTLIEEQLRDVNVATSLISPDGKLLIVASALLLRRFDVDTGAELAYARIGKPKENKDDLDVYPTAMALSPDAARVLLGWSDGRAELWDLATTKRVWSVGAGDVAVTAVAFSTDGARALTATRDYSFKMWDVGTHVVVPIGKGHGAPVYGVGYAGAAKIISAGGDGTVRLWDRATGAEATVFKGHHGAVYGLGVDAGGTVAVSAGVDGSVRAWDLAKGTGKVLSSGLDEQYAAAVSPDGTRALAAGLDGDVREYNPGPTKAGGVGSLPGHRPFVNVLAFSTDGARAASGGNDGYVRLYDPAKQRDVARLDGHEGFVTGISFLGDGRILSASEDDTMRLWAADGSTSTVFHGHTNALTACAACPDGSCALSASKDGSVRIWDLATGQEIDRIDLAQIGDVPLALAIAPDQSTFLVGTRRGVVLEYDLQH
jgi:WD40 repeat protein